MFLFILKVVIKDPGKLFGSIVLCLAAGFAGSFFTTSSITGWYATLNKPFFNPPNFVFAPVWTILYILMGISLYLVWSSEKSKQTGVAITFFMTQLILNVSWSIVFFGLHFPAGAFATIIALFLAILFTILKFSKISKNAAYLLYPYIAWVLFASFLNLAIVVLNL